jgi:hypothetical protein
VSTSAAARHAPMDDLGEAKLDIMPVFLLMDTIDTGVENACGQSGSVAVRPRF